MKLDYSKLMMELASKILRLRDVNCKSHIRYGSEISSATAYHAYEDSTHLMEEILNQLKKNKQHIIEIPGNYRKIVKAFMKDLYYVDFSMDLIAYDQTFASYVNSEDVKKMITRFKDLKNETKKFLAEIGKEDKSWRLLI